MTRRLLLVLALLAGCAQQALAIGFAGNFTTGSTVYITFNSYDNQSNPTTLVSGTVKCYKDNNTAESTAGITLTTDFDSRTGFHIVVVDTSADGTFYAAGHDFECVLTAGTVRNTSVIGSVVGTFSLQNRYNTVSANVTQWAGTNVATPDTAGYPKVTGKSGTGTGEFNLSSGVIDANVTKFGGSTGTFASGRPEVNASHIGGSAISQSSGVANVRLTATGVDDIWDEVQSGHTTAGTFGKYVDAQISGISGGGSLTAAQVWDYATSSIAAAGSIGKLVKDDLDAAITSRLASGSYTAPDNSSITAIKLQTDKFLFTVTNQVDANVLDWKSATAPAMTGDAYARLGSPAGASVSADVAAVKAVLPSALTGAGNIKADAQVVSDKTGYSLSTTGDEQDQPSGTVVADAGNSTTQAKTDLTSATDDRYKDLLIRFKGASCNLVTEVAKVTAYNGTTKIITWTPAKTAAPTTTDCTFILQNR